MFDEPDDTDHLSNHFPRSASCPSLQTYGTHRSTEFERKRALSDYHVYSNECDTLLSRRSESDLLRINKSKTFSEKNDLPFDTGDVLARVVHALDNIRVQDDENNGDDTQETETMTSVISVKSSEHEYSVPPDKPRLRAVSAYRKPSLTPIESPHKWTWNGTNAQIQEFRNMRHKLNIKENEDKNRSWSVKIDDPSVRPLISPLQHKLHPVNKVHQLHKQLSVDHHQKRYSIVGQENLLLKRRSSRIGYFKPSQNPSSRRPSIFEIQENQADKNLLENTTIADLIRVLETAHTLNNSSHDPALQELLGVSPLISPKRLNRRASMYPRYSEQVPLIRKHHIPFINGNFITHPDDQLPLSKADLDIFAQRRTSVYPNPLRRSSITNSTITRSINQRRQSMRPSHWLNHNYSNDSTEVTGRFTVSKRLRPTNSFRMQNNFLRRAVVQSSNNSLSELNEKSDDRIV